MSYQQFQFESIHHPETQPLQPDVFSHKKIRVDILRLDKIHPVISGNKWFKLKYHLQEARQKQFKTILTFGGEWSNHIVATAFAARQAGFPSVGIIRGDVPDELSDTLKTAESFGMKIEFVSRNEFRTIMDVETIGGLLGRFGPAYIIPQGGAGPNGIRGSREILQLVPSSSGYSHIMCCIGTGTMFVGLANGSRLTQEIVGIPVLKGMNKLSRQNLENIEDASKSNYLRIIEDYHFGGYAKKTPELLQFMNDFFIQTGIPSDFVYTGKMFFAMSDLARKGYFPDGSNILLIHSGGLQGNDSLPEGCLLF